MQNADERREASAGIERRISAVLLIAILECSMVILQYLGNGALSL